MFQAVPPPIIRSTKLYIQRQVLSNKYCCYHGRDGTYHKIYIFDQHIYNFFTKYPQATCFGFLGPSSGLIYEQVPLILVHFGIPNCYRDVINLLAPEFYI